MGNVSGGNGGRGGVNGGVRGKEGAFSAGMGGGNREPVQVDSGSAAVGGGDGGDADDMTDGSSCGGVEQGTSEEGDLECAARSRGGGRGMSTHGAMLPKPPGRGADDAASAGTAGISDRMIEGGSPARDGAGGGSLEGSVNAQAMGDGDGSAEGWASVARGQESGARMRGKSTEATGSTGVSPMQKRNRRELKVGHLGGLRS